jgi:hypothetical protein
LVWFLHSDSPFSRQKKIALSLSKGIERRVATFYDLPDIPGARRSIAEGRSFMAYLEKWRIEIGAVQLANVEQYLQQARRLYRQRHGHFPEYKSWRGTQTMASICFCAWSSTNGRRCR